MTTLVVVDDHPVVRDGIRAALASREVDIVAECSTAADGIEAALRLKPDVVLMDLGLPDVSGIEAIATLTAREPGIAVIAFTMADDDGSILGALRAGAAGYLLKGASGEELATAIGVAAASSLYVADEVARRLRAHLAPGAGAPAPTVDGLTPREHEVLELVAAGWGNARIAQQLYLAPKTVRNLVSSILAKMGAADRGEVIVAARRLGFGDSAR